MVEKGKGFVEVWDNMVKFTVAPLDMPPEPCGLDKEHRCDPDCDQEPLFLTDGKTDFCWYFHDSEKWMTEINTQVDVWVSGSDDLMKEVAAVTKGRDLPVFEDPLVVIAALGTDIYNYDPEFVVVSLKGVAGLFPHDCPRYTVITLKKKEESADPRIEIYVVENNWMGRRVLLKHLSQNFSWKELSKFFA